MLRRSFNEDWYVKENRQWPEPEGAGEAINLPHDAMIGTKREEDRSYWFRYGGFKGEDRTYEKKFALPEIPAGKKMYLEFEGVYYNSRVLVNGTLAARQPYGYSRFLADITPFVKEGENEVRVCTLTGANPNSRWYPGNGIYRDVWLLEGDTAHTDPWGIRVTTKEIAGDLAQITADIDIVNEGTYARTLRAQIRILSPEGKEAGKAEIPFTVLPGKKAGLHQNFVIKDPALWSPETPCLYGIGITLCEDGREIDTARDRFGIRKVSADPVRGFLVNGKSYKLRGGCIHHDNGPIGAAEFKTAALRRVKLMKEAGYNAIRSSHNPMSPALLEACDELGILVMDESFDTWNIPKTNYDYNMFFREWWEKDVRSMVAKDYNHPSVVMYSIGNEISERDGSDDGGALARMQAELIRSLDATRPVTSAINGIAEPGSFRGERKSFTGEKGFMGVPHESFSSRDHSYFIAKSDDYAEALDVMSLNYLHTAYEEIGRERPGRVLCGTESMVAQYADVWGLVEKHPYVIGDFCWTAWEYLGEAGCGKIDYQEDGNERALKSFMGDYPWVMAYCGDFDLTGARRTQSYYREIVWKLRKEPFIAVQRPEKHGLTPSYTPWSWSDTAACWTWPGFEGKETDIEVYADADEVELFLNGKSLGREKVSAYHAVFTAAYEPGTLEATAYRDGKETGRCALKTTGKAEKLRLTCETGDMKAGGSDVSYIRIEAVDTNGERVYARPGIRVSVTGAGALGGLGSGDPMTKDDYTSGECSLFDGTAIAILRSTKEKGECTLTVSGEGFEPVSCTVQAV